jgi:hypothetical protein
MKLASSNGMKERRQFWILAASSIYEKEICFSLFTYNQYAIDIYAERNET